MGFPEEGWSIAGSRPSAGEMEMGERQRCVGRLRAGSQVARRYGVAERNNHVRDRMVGREVRVSLTRYPTTKWA